MSIDPEDLNRLAEGRWPTSWIGASFARGWRERIKIALALAISAMLVALLLGWPVYNALIS